ncbi:MAG: M48 family metalloprotease [Deltaproteobacteria bacterium]|nr:MAG: M48 family metalloprotease [Deltaproteobacteria bacterium]
MSPSADSHKKYGPRLILLLVILLLLCANACTVKHANVTPGVIPKGKLITLQDEQYGEILFADLKKKNELCTDDRRYDQLVTVCNHLTQVAEADHNPWKLHLFRNPDVIDVRVVHGNYIFVWSGLLDVAQDEDEIAAMLAYEIAHALTRHTDPVKFTIWSEVFFETASLATSMAILVASQGTVAITGSGWMKWLYMKAADLMPLEREYSKEEEREAAEVAYMILVRSKYSPQAMVKFWKRVLGNEALQGKVKRLNRDLPPQERVAILEELLPKYAGQQEEKNKKQETEPIEATLQASAEWEAF